MRNSRRMVESLLSVRMMRGSELRSGDVVVRRDAGGHILQYDILEKKVPVFDGKGSSGRACNGVHFRINETTVCYDKCALNEVIRDES